MAVRQREGAVTINSLAASLGVEIQNVKNRLSAIPDIIRNEKNELLSLNEIDTKSPSFLKLLADIERLVDIHGSISCMGIFKKKQVTCMDVGITDSRLLFDVVSDGIQSCAAAIIVIGATR